MYELGTLRLCEEVGHAITVEVAQQHPIGQALGEAVYKFRRVAVAIALIDEDQVGIARADR
ncbi:hypothetical protein RZS08_48875, partial [Arthrospira platensis SPKY1]|nr:hypothetical protein [Arthrospira platensis SPKY1]